MFHVRRRWVVGGLVAGLTGAALATGCTPRQTDSASPRAQAEYDPEKDAAATVGGKTVMGNTDPIPVSGVGLVYQLKGTGSSPQPDGWRETLEKALKKRKLNPKEVLDDPARSTSLVLVSGVIPPGARNGDKLDVTVTLPGGSKTTSLQHGVLDLCDLTNYEMSGSLKQSLANSGVPNGKVPQAAANELLMGNRVAAAEGPLVAGVLLPMKGEGAADAPASDMPAVRAAKVWGGMTNLIDRPYHFLLNGDAPQPRLAMVVAARMNAVFHGTTDRAGKVAEAQVQGRRPMVTAFVPPTYRLNHHRFILVARNIPLTAPGPNDPYRKKLER
ncbi:MAG: flagellar basal body P-ring protein FlgI, partial [Gemmataceae bacterium]